MRCLALFNGLNLSEKLKILRDEGKIDDELAAALREFGKSSGLIMNEAV